jgi:CHAD domain-containing protein
MKRPARRAITTGPTSVVALRDALLTDITSAAQHLARRRKLGVRAVHDTRRRLKRARAVLALIRPALADEDFAACDHALREAGRSLAAARDAAVLARTYAKLGVRTATDKAPPNARPAATVAARKQHSADPTRSRQCLQAASDRLAQAPLSGRDWQVLGQGLRKVYRRGRRRVPRQTGHAPSDALHAWRRHAKRWWHVLEVFEVVAPKRLAGAIADAKKLADLLGDEHDFALLAVRIRGQHGKLAASDAAILERIDRRRSKLRRRAGMLGARVYADRPGDMERQMHRDWNRWRDAGAPTPAPDGANGESRH